MAKELLNNVDHHDLKIRTGHGTQFGDNVNMVITFPTEFADMQREYPILFRKDANDELISVALLGLDKGENLYLDGGGWRARYIPAIQQRGPFLIGFQDKQVDGETVKEAMVHVDMDHPRVNREEGAPVFLPQGGNSPFLDRINKVLNVIHQGVEFTKPMFDAFEEAGLIEPCKIEIKLSDREQYNLQDYYQIDEQKLGELSGEALEKLNRRGFLAAAYMVVASLGNVRHLIYLKNRNRAAAESQA